MARLYNIDTPEGLSDCLNAFQTAFEDFRTLARGRDMEFINDALDESRPISPRLYQLYSETLRKAVGMAGVSQDLQDQWLANVSRFAAYKAARATDMIREAVAADGVITDGINPLRAHARYLAAEANTARTRARTGKQWQQFSDPDHARLFPNIRWIASRSATPREAHMPFYGRVWAKDDPFWQHNQPGTLWNCKCDWEETDDPVTTGNPQKNIELPGLKGNPAETGQIFSDDAPYFRKAPKGTDVIVKQSIREIFRQEHANDYIEFNTPIGKIIYDNISVQEISKGAKTDASYFYKLEIAQHLDKYIDEMTVDGPNETIDLTHNNPRKIFFQRKKNFLHMRVYRLNINDYTFRIKLGEYPDGSLNLYAITEP